MVDENDRVGIPSRPSSNSHRRTSKEVSAEPFSSIQHMSAPRPISSWALMKFKQRHRRPRWFWSSTSVITAATQAGFDSARPGCRKLRPNSATTGPMHVSERRWAPRGMDCHIRWTGLNRHLRDRSWPGFRDRPRLMNRPSCPGSDPADRHRFSPRMVRLRPRPIVLCGPQPCLMGQPLGARYVISRAPRTGGG